MIRSSEVLDRLIASLGLQADNDLALVLCAAYSTVRGWRSRNSLPYADVLALAAKRDIDLNWLLFGKPVIASTVDPNFLQPLFRRVLARELTTDEMRRLADEIDLYQR